MLETPRLAKRISEYFALYEVEMICAELGVDAENLKWDTKIELAFALIIYCSNRGLLARLYEILKEQRPQIIWEEIESKTSSIENANKETNEDNIFKEPIIKPDVLQTIKLFIYRIPRLWLTVLISAIFVFFIIYIIFPTLIDEYAFPFFEVEEPEWVHLTQEAIAVPIITPKSTIIPVTPSMLMSTVTPKPEPLISITRIRGVPGCGETWCPLEIVGSVSNFDEETEKIILLINNGVEWQNLNSSSLGYTEDGWLFYTDPIRRTTSIKFVALVVDETIVIGDVSNYSELEYKAISEEYMYGID